MLRSSHWGPASCCAAVRVRFSRSRSTVLTVLGIILLVASATILGSHYFGHGRAGRTLSSAPLPPGLRPGPTTTTPGARATAPPAVAVKAGIPVTLIIADHHVQAPVSANALNADGSLYVPPDPADVSWSSQDVAPGSGFGTIILVAHINMGGVAGAFSDLGDYRVGQVITVVLADGRRMKYEVAAAPMQVNKDQVGPRRAELFDQSHSYALIGHPKSARLLLLSCGGVFDNRTGHYESNIFVYALPV